MVEGLFNMSNELREERESIMAHGKDGAGNMEAFINRETTMKYNEELDAVSRVSYNEQTYCDETQLIIKDPRVFDRVERMKFLRNGKPHCYASNERR